MTTKANRSGHVIAVSISDRKGIKKHNVDSADLLEAYGISDDAHAGNWHRQVSLLGIESIRKIQAKGLDVLPGDFAENITTEGLCLYELMLGTKIEIGENVVLEITQIGKECHQRCNIYYQTGDCVMPKRDIRAGSQFRSHQTRRRCPDNLNYPLAWKSETYLQTD